MVALSEGVFGEGFVDARLRAMPKSFALRGGGLIFVLLFILLLAFMYIEW